MVASCLGLLNFSVHFSMAPPVYTLFKLINDRQAS